MQPCLPSLVADFAGKEPGKWSKRHSRSGFFYFISDKQLKGLIKWAINNSASEGLAEEDVATEAEDMEFGSGWSL